LTYQRVRKLEEWTLKHCNYSRSLKNTTFLLSPASLIMSSTPDGREELIGLLMGEGAACPSRCENWMHRVIVLFLFGSSQSCGACEDCVFLWWFI